MGLEPTRLWLDTGTSSLPVYLFQHSRIGLPSRRSVIIDHNWPFVNSFFLLISPLAEKLSKTDEDMEFSPADPRRCPPGLLRAGPHCCLPDARWAGPHRCLRFSPHSYCRQQRRRSQRARSRSLLQMLQRSHPRPLEKKAQAGKSSQRARSRCLLQMLQRPHPRSLEKTGRAMQRSLQRFQRPGHALCRRRERPARQ